MPEWLQALILGVVQGLTEFLPVSSSGHLVLVQSWFGDAFAFVEDVVLFDLVLHLGTLLPVLLFYRKDVARLVTSLAGRGESAIVRKDRQFVVWVVLATIPTGLAGILLRDVFESLFHSVEAVCVALLFTGSLLLASAWADRTGRPRRELSASLALVLGCAQALAITPGVSRSGTTISVALLLGVERSEAARFSFLMSIPAILGAAVVQAKDGVDLDADLWGPLVLGFMASFVSGVLALRWLVHLIRGGRFYVFAFYVIPLALIVGAAQLWGDS